VSGERHRLNETTITEVLRAEFPGIRKVLAPGALSDSDVVLYATWISVWGRWFVWVVSLFQILHRPHFWYSQAVEYLAIPVVLGLVNSFTH
jgi:hypothetical protein